MGAAEGPGATKQNFGWRSGGEFVNFIAKGRSVTGPFLLLAAGRGSYRDQPPAHQRGHVMRVSRCVATFLVCFTAVLVVQAMSPGAQSLLRPDSAKRLPDIRNVMIIDGSTVHNVGELRMHVGNWGLFGSMPSSSLPFSFAPSAEWPAESGVEYLFSAGLWIGALRLGVPGVSTAQYESEFRPTPDPVDMMYRSSEGAPGGNRLPHPAADDDRDGAVDEDWLNGRDDDGDGLVDEDYAAISDQMLSCWYTDDQPQAIAIYPEHNPLNLRVRQESYQWGSDAFDDFVAVNFEITNIGTVALEDVYIGMFADMDAGHRTTPNYWEDDATGFVRAAAPCGIDGTVNLDIAYGYDADGDGGQTNGYFGILLLDHTTDPTGQNAPQEALVSTYANFSGNQPFEDGGDPTNDFERYELLSQEIIERGGVIPRDYRTLMAVGPFPSLAPGESLMFRVAWVIGAGLQGMIDNAAAAKCLYEANWYPSGPPLFTHLDVDPGKCPAELRAKPRVIGKNNENSNAGGVLQAAVLARPGFDVNEIDVSSVRLEGAVPSMKAEYRDVASGPTRERACACPEGPDGLTDLVLKFRESEVVAGLGSVSGGEERTVTLYGRMKDGREFFAADCVVIRVPGSDGRPDHADRAAETAGVRTVLPNPFNPTTRVSYYLPGDADVTIAVYDAAGRLVARLVNGYQSAGGHTVEWNAAGTSSGIYFCRFESSGTVEVKKLILLK